MLNFLLFIGSVFVLIVLLLAIFLAICALVYTIADSI